MVLLFAALGLGVAALTTLFLDVRRRRRLARRKRFARVGETASATVERIWEESRGRRRTAQLHFVDLTGRARTVTATLSAAEAAAVGLRHGQRLGVRYLAGAPNEVDIERPAVLDDRAIVCWIAGLAVLALFVALGAALP